MMEQVYTTIVEPTHDASIEKLAAMKLQLLKENTKGSICNVRVVIHEFDPPQTIKRMVIYYTEK